ncbi:hypothetical protein QTP86_005335 [Hemibagrus guttatus]|nr:hypothetical protein QTP86_005335 [Hemibagrus guttatus]
MLANTFGDLEKAYDRVPREELWYCMRKSGVAEKYVRVVQDMYERSRTVVRCAVGQTEEFKVEVGLHQGSALSPFLFAIVMDQLSEEFSMTAEYGGQSVNTEEERWEEATETEESLDLTLQPHTKMYIWQYKLGFGKKDVLFCRDLVVDDDPNPPSTLPLPAADNPGFNTYFQKREEHRVTYKSGGRRTQIEKKTKWWKLKKEECSEVIRETGRKVLGVSSGRRKEDKETWWWNEEVQDSIQRKRLAKKKWDMDRTEENRQEYKELQRRVKREVSKAKQKAYEELYTRLDTREGEKDLYRLARQRDRDGKDVQQVRVIKDRDGRVLTSEESVQRRWKEYFEELMNEENEREKRVEGVNSVEQKVDKIRKDEVRKALKRMKSGKAVGPDDIPVEVWKCLGEAAVEFLASLFNRVLENLEKAYDRVPREELWYCMRKSGVAEKYVRVVQDMYERSRTVVRCAVGQTEEFNVEVGLHQGSALSPFLFAIVMDQLSEEVRQESPWTMMFADDIVICSESREQVEENLERWRFALERRGMKVSRSKTEYMCVNEREGSGTVRLQGEEVKKVQEFKYLGSTVQSNGECGKEVKKRVQAGWNGWRKVSGVLCDQKISARIKGKVYRTVVRPAMLYGLETVSLRKRQESELEASALISAYLVDISSWMTAHQLKLNPSKTELLVIPGKGRELADVMERRKVDILCVQETRWKGSKACSIGAGFKLFYYGVDSKRNGVGVVLKEEFVRNVLEVGCELEEKERFWSELDEVMESIPTGDEEVMGKFGVKERNLEGQMVVDFAKRMDMGVVNTYFQKREEHRVTYKSGARQHRMVVCRMTLMKLRQALGGQVVLPDDWETTAEVIRETGRKDSIQRKRLAKKKWDMDRTEENRQEYKELQCRVKREVSKAKQKAYEELYTRLDTREGEKDLYRVLTSEESVQRRWKEYFEELMNEENEREKRVEGVNSVEQEVDKIRKDEVRKALKRMKSGKAVGPDDIPVEVWKCLGEAAVEFLANLFNRVLENLEKAYDRVPREELWYCMRKSGVAEKYVRVVQDMYERSRTVVRCAVGQTEEFNVEVGLHQGSALSPFLFAIVMDQLSEEVRQESPWTMMFADDIVICSESREQVEENLERWRFALERRGMKVSRSKTEYMCVNEREGSGTVRLQGEEVKKVQEFKYLGSTVQSNGECGKEVKKRVQAGWNGWRKVSGVLCDQKISARIKGKVYRTVVRPAMLYGLETVSLRKRQESELEVAELKMLRFSLGVTRLDRIRNEYIRGTAHVGRLGDKVREARLRWFGHVQRRDRWGFFRVSACAGVNSNGLNTGD